MSQSESPHTPRVLLVEDDEEFREIVARRLLRRGMYVEGVERGADARKACQTGRFDVVLLDGTLPDGDGLSLLAEFRHQWPHLPVIFLSGHGEKGAIVTALSRGACQYLVKPASLAQVEEAISLALALREESRPN